MEFDAQNEADAILSAVQLAPKDTAWQLLSLEEQVSIMAARDRLLEVKHGDNPAAIREAIALLDLATRRYAELMMETAVRNAVRG